jgi:hypothetical protein
MARNVQSRRSGGRRYKLVLGLAAIGAFLLALPAAAFACVTTAGCQAVGGFVLVTGGGVCINIGGPLNGQPICGPASIGQPPKGWIPALINWGMHNPQTLENIENLLNPEASALEWAWTNGPGSAMDFGQGEGSQWGTTSQGDVIGPAVPPGHLGMYTSSSTPDQSGWGAVGGGGGLRSSGYGISDTAGAITPGATGPNFHDTFGNGGIYGTFDASRYFGVVGAGQSVLLSGFFDYRRDNLSIAADPSLAQTVVGNAGGIGADTYTFGGSALYRSGTVYAIGFASYSFGHANETDNVTPATGGFGTHGYFVDGRLGKVFVLFNPAGEARPAVLPTKAPPRAAAGPVVALDLSGHVGYAENSSNSFTDTSGFTYGTGKSEQGDVGARARLVAYLPNNGLIWMPYVSVTVDQLFGVSNTLNIPNQTAMSSGDLISLQTAKTFGGADLGVDVRGPGGAIVGVKGFYQASADTNIIGGSANVKFPFNYTPRPAFATRY